MHISFALFADAANISQEGKLNILGVFDALQVTAVPTLHPRAHLVVRFKGTPRDAGKHTVMLRWMNPAGHEIWQSVGELNVVQPPHGIAEMDLPLIATLDLPIDQPGAYHLNIALDDTLSTDLPLMVRSGGTLMPPSGMLA